MGQQIVDAMKQIAKAVEELNKAVTDHDDELKTVIDKAVEELTEAIGKLAPSLPTSGQNHAIETYESIRKAIAFGRIGTRIGISQDQKTPELSDDSRLRAYAQAQRGVVKVVIRNPYPGDRHERIAWRNGFDKTSFSVRSVSIAGDEYTWAETDIRHAFRDDIELTCRLRSPVAAVAADEAPLSAALHQRGNIPVVVVLKESSSGETMLRASLVII